MIVKNLIKKSRPKESPPNPRLHFRRFEFKYLLAPGQAEKVKAYLSNYLSRDPFIAERGQERYEVLSLYYDTPFYYYYYEKIDGVKKRKKIRLRTYRTNGSLSPYVFFEIKRKDDVVITKDRFLLSADDYQALRSNHNFNHLKETTDENRQALIGEFAKERARRAIQPILLVVYEREPYLGKLNPNLRLTFDTNLRAAEDDDLLSAGDGLLDVLGGQVIMELKFNGTLPGYIHNVIRFFNLERLAYSKYCRGLERCRRLPLNNLFSLPARTKSLLALA